MRRESGAVPRQFADVSQDERGERRGLRARRIVMGLLALVRRPAWAARDGLEGELRAEARLQSIASLDQLRFAVLETNGKISFISR